MLTLAIFTAVARAGEFHPDQIFGTAVFLFTLASFIGQVVGRSIPGETIMPLIIVATTIYALAVMLHSYARWQQASVPSKSDYVEKGENSDDGKPTLADNCLKIAEEHGLTRRELEILEILADGHSGPYISETLFISDNTVRTHIRNIYRKLGIGSREDILRITRM